MSAEFTYHIFEGLLIGYAGTHHFSISARSGGAGGSTKLDTTLDANNPYSTCVAKEAGVRGGPLPVGRYHIGRPFRHPHLGPCAHLDPEPGTRLCGRSGFFIHGRGPMGSDGCIVPLERFAELMEALQQEGGGKLYVSQATGAGAFV